MDPEHLAREVAIFAERCDIAEEIARLRGHVEQFRQAVSSPEPAGTEAGLHRPGDAARGQHHRLQGQRSRIARAVVEIKTAMDRIKEQVQNVE